MLYSIQQANFMKRRYEIHRAFRYDRVINRYDMLTPMNQSLVTEK